MRFELSTLFIVAVSYLLLLFGLAYLTDRGIIRQRWVRHPAVYVLSLGVFAGAWAFYGVFGLASRYGYGFLAYYFGASSIFIFAPLVLVPQSQ